MKSVSGTLLGSATKNFTLIFCSSMDGWKLRARLRGDIDFDRRRAAHFIVAIVGRINKELRFLDELHGTIVIHRSTFADEFLGLEQVFGEFSPGIFVVEKLRVVEPARELRKNLILIFGDARVLLLHQSLRRAHHGSIGGLRRVLRTAGVQLQLSLEQFALAGGERKLSLAHDLASALADSHVCEGKLPRIAPVTVIRGVHIVGGNPGEIFQEVLDLFFTDPPNEVLEALALLALAHVIFGDRQYCFRYALRRHGSDGHAVLAGVVMKLAAENDLKVRHLKPLHVAVDAIKPDVGDMVLAARVEAAAYFDAQILHRLIQLQALFTEAITQLPRKPARRGDAQFARVSARACGYIHDGRGVRSAQPDGFDSPVEFREVCLAEPAKKNVLLHRRAQRVLDKASRDVGESAQLAGAHVP